MCIEYNRIPIDTYKYLSMNVASGVVALVLLLLLLLLLCRCCFYYLSFLFIIIWFWIRERRYWFDEKNCMCIEYDRTPIKTYVYTYCCVSAHWVVGVWECHGLYCSLCPFFSLSGVASICNSISLDKSYSGYFFSQ